MRVGRSATCGCCWPMGGIYLWQTSTYGYCTVMVEVYLRECLNLLEFSRRWLVLGAVHLSIRGVLSGQVSTNMSCPFVLLVCGICLPLTRQGPVYARCPFTGVSTFRRYIYVAQMGGYHLWEDQRHCWLYIAWNVSPSLFSSSNFHLMWHVYLQHMYGGIWLWDSLEDIYFVLSEGSSYGMDLMLLQ